MRAALALAALALLSPSVAALADGESRATERHRIVDRELAGKQPGAEEFCISARQPYRLIVESDDALLLRVSSRLVYRNQLRESCPGMALSPYQPALSSRGPQICQGDLVTIERGLGTDCVLGAFLPYRTPAQ